MTTLSPKHLQALEIIARDMRLRTISVKHGKLRYTPRNTAYRVMRELGYYYSDTLNQWFKP